MPRPATRATLGTSAVSATMYPSSSAVSISRKAPTPPLTSNPATKAAGAPDGSDPEPFSGDGVQLAVAMARDQDFHPMLRAPDERHQEMLAMPHGDDHRRVPGDVIVDVLRLDRKS